MPEPQGPFEKFGAGLKIENRFETPKVLAAYYQATFNNLNGREVLADILETASVFDLIRDEEDRYHHNLGIGILNLLGIIKRNPDGQITNMRQIVDSLLNIQEGRT